MKESLFSGFVDELSKIADLPSEIGGSILWGGSGAPAIGGLIAAAKGGYKSREDYERAKARGASNVLLPGAGAYRGIRRALTKKEVLRKKKKE